MKSIKIQTKKIMIAAVVLFSVGCARSDGFENSMSDNEEADSGETFQAAVGGDVEALEIQDGQATVTVDSDEDVTIAFYSYDTGSSTHSYQVGAGSSTTNLTMHLEDDQDESDFDGDLTGDFHMMLRDAESTLEGDVAETDTRYAVKALAVDDEKTFKVLNSFSSNGTSYDTVTATLRYENEYYQFFVDNRDASSMSDDDLEELAADFSAVIPTEREIFGTESDINSDGKFAVLFTRTVNALGASQGGIVTGFFYAIDLFEDNKYPASNEMEVIYTFVPDPQGKLGTAISKSFALNNIIKGVLPHEYQHMINYNMHALENGGATEYGWLNEGLSHMAEDFSTMDENNVIQSFGLENPSRVSSYLSNTSGICFTCGTSLSQRGGIYLFLKYLYEQADIGRFDGVASGNEMLTSLLDTSKRGVNNVVTTVFGDTAADTRFMELMGQFSLAVYLSNTDKTADEHYNFTGIDLRSIIDDNRGTVLNGPAVQKVTSLPFTDSLTGSSIGFVQIPADEIAAAGGIIKITTGDDNVGAFLVR